MEDSNGWIKLYRKLLQSPIFQNEKALKIWIWCLCKASHKERDQLVGKQLIHLEEGQFITGRIKASEELKMNQSTVYKYLIMLKNQKMVHIESSNRFSIITIENWKDYQIEDLKNDNKNNNKITTKEHKQECKEIYIYFINKYKSEKKGFFENLRILREMKKDERYRELTAEEEYELRNIILGGD